MERVIYFFSGMITAIVCIVVVVSYKISEVHTSPCTHCGNDIFDSYKYCRYCGAENKIYKIKEGKNKKE